MCIYIHTIYMHRVCPKAVTGFYAITFTLASIKLRISKLSWSTNQPKNIYAYLHTYMHTYIQRLNTYITHLHHITLHCISLLCTTLLSLGLPCFANRPLQTCHLTLQNIPFHEITLHCMALHTRTTQHYITLHYIAVQYSTVQYSTVQYSTLHTRKCIHAWAHISEGTRIHKHLCVYIYTYAYTLIFMCTHIHT